MRLLVLAALLCSVTTPALAQSRIKAGDVVTITRSSVFIYEAPGGPDEGEVTRQDLRSNGDVIIVQESRAHRGEVWYRVKITAGKQQGTRSRCRIPSGGSVVAMWPARSRASRMGHRRLGCSGSGRPSASPVW